MPANGSPLPYWPRRSLAVKRATADSTQEAALSKAVLRSPFSHRNSFVLIFFPVTPEGGPPLNTYIAAFNPSDGTFRAVGPDGNGIPPGKYRIAVEHSRKRKDLFHGSFDGEHSPFVFDIDASTQDIVIDLDKK